MQSYGFILKQPKFSQLFCLKSSSRKTKQFSSYSRFPNTYTTVRAVRHTAVPIFGATQDISSLK